MTARLERIRQEQIGQRRRILTFTLIYAGCLVAGWYLGAFVTLIERGPGVAPW